MFKIPTAAVDEREINFLYSHVGQPILLQYQVAALARIKVADTTLVKVFKGIIPATYHLPALNADPFDLDKRMANLNSSLRYIDSLNGCVELIRNIDATEYKKLKTEFKEWFDDLNANVVFLKKINDQINKAVLSLGKESMWLAQGTRSGDLKTTGSRHVTVDVGMTDIMAFDNSNKYKSIPKLFFGLNYYFRSIDKNADWNKIPDPGAPDKNTAHYLESRYSVLQRLSLTGGFTLGAMQNKDFDNVYNGLSFTLGPSYRIGKIFKISVGAAFLKRYDNEPIRTHSSIVLGDYVSLSLDYDLLTAASNITGMLFK